MTDVVMTAAEVGLSIHEAAERVGLSVHTLRYYERAGLLPTVGRADGSGHRRYTERDLGALHFLQKMRTTGMPIREMRRYMDLVREGDATIETRRRMLEAHGETVRRQIADLQASLTVIENKVASYRCLGPAECTPDADGFIK